MNTYEANIYFVGIRAAYVLYPSASTKEDAEKMAREIITKYEPSLTIKKIIVKKINKEVVG